MKPIAAETRSAIIADLAARQRTAAIKRYRGATGASLLESYYAIKNIAEELRSPHVNLIDSDMRAAILEELGARRRIAAIRMYRAATGASLVESYHALKTLSTEALAPGHGAREVFGSTIGWLFGALPLLYVAMTSLRVLPLPMKIFAVAVGATLGIALRRATATRVAANNHAQ